MSDRSIILGVDPGSASGAWAIYNSTTPDMIFAEDMPLVGKEVNFDALSERIRWMQPTLAIIEKVNGYGGQGGSASFKFGVSYGVVLGIVAALVIPMRRPTPAVWKKAMGLTSDKERSRARAIERWPGAGCFTRKKDDGRAEAALLALWGEKFGG